jgi:hypothetical protein
MFCFSTSMLKVSMAMAMLLASIYWLLFFITSPMPVITFTKVSVVAAVFS